MDSESLNDCNQIKQKILYTDGGLRDILIERGQVFNLQSSAG
jgi:hypothetical protein